MSEEPLGNATLAAASYESYFAGVVGQDAAVAQLVAAVARPVHAYLFVGPSGSGKRAAALAFAAALLDDERALAARHPDVMVIEREGASINVAQAREITRLAVRSPIEGARKVLVLTEFHLVEEAAPALLKTIEEASETTVFVILADHLPRELATVASRCVRIDFGAVAPDVIEAALVADGVVASVAAEAAAASFGSLERARLLSVDSSLVDRRRLWTSAPDSLDGTGSSAAVLADAVVASIDQAIAPLVARHEQERTEAEAQVSNGGQSSQLLKVLETRHKRELRRFRTDEIRAGLATLARALVERLAAADSVARARQSEAGLQAVQQANEAIAFNPNETLFLQGLFVKIGQPALVLTGLSGSRTH